MGLNLYRGFESLGLRQDFKYPVWGICGFGDQRCPCGHRVWDSKGLACKPSRGLQYVGESLGLRQDFKCPARGICLSRVPNESPEVADRL